MLLKLCLKQRSCDTDLPIELMTQFNTCSYGRNLYWSDWNRDAPKIETSYMDGSNRRVLVRDDLGLPNGLTYDSQSSMLCWADAGTVDFRQMTHV